LRYGAKNVVANLTVLGANVTQGIPAISERLTSTAAMLAARGMDAMASRAASEIFGVVQFSTFATLSANSRPARCRINIKDDLIVVAMHQ
jgi:hypothetical protein